MFQTRPKPNPACMETPLMQSEVEKLCNRPHLGLIFLWPLHFYIPTICGSLGSFNQIQWTFLILYSQALDR